MLQIISGKFFGDGDRHVSPAKGITYSNYWWFSPIETCVAKLEPTSPYSSAVSAYVIEYLNQIEKEAEGRQDVLVKVGDTEILRQFQCIATFGLKSLFAVDRWEVEFACRSQARDSADSFVPQRIVPRFFNAANRGTPDDATQFSSLVSKIIGLPRDQYVGLVAALATFRHALLILSHSLDMAYSLVVYCLESLSQRFDAFDPTWQDYDDQVRSKLDPLLADIDSAKACEIRSALLNSGSLRLQKRFVDFIANHVDDTFYVDEAESRQSAVTPSELRRALKNSYNLRSSYVHMLKPLPDYLRMLQLPDEDLFPWDNEPYLTFSGLIRIAHHAIRQFIERGEYVQTESYDWRAEVPGTITLKMAPQYWIGNTSGVQPEGAASRLSGFLSMFQGWLTHEKPVGNLCELMLAYERLLPHAKKEYKPAMVGLYFLFGALPLPENPSRHYQDVIERHRDILDERRMETLIVRLLVEDSLPWPVEECAAVLEEFNQTRFRKHSVTIPKLLELGLIVHTANAFLSAGNLQEYDRWARVAHLEAAGAKEVQEHIRQHISGKTAFDPVWIVTGGRLDSTSQIANEKESETEGNSLDAASEMQGS
ncbi:MAG: hypothetical protein HQ581_02915 [Planctomycetes bacterium]|nr:hypothetical protein [Planctomycetota bacterium]